MCSTSGEVMLLQQGHYKDQSSGGEVWGLAVHPSDPDTFATAGDGKQAHSVDTTSYTA